MSVSVELLSIKSPNPRISRSYGVAKRTLCTSPAIRFDSRSCQVSLSVEPPRSVSAKGLGDGFHLPVRMSRSVVALAASHEESKSSEIDIEKEGEDIKATAKESEEAWKQTLEAFKEQALKMQSVSQEAYDVYSARAMVILKETSEQLKIQAEKARQDLSVLAKDLSEEGRVYLTTAAENSPEPVKEIVETLSSSTDDLKEISKIRDFRLGIPYGLLLSLGGFLSFMVTGSISAIRFGVILGGTLLALSMASLRSYKRGETSPLALKGQAAISAIIFLREMRLLFQRFTFPNFLTTFVSGAMVVFYVYRITVEGKRRKGSDMEYGGEN